MEPVGCDVSTAALLEHMAGDLGFMVGFLGKVDRINERVVLIDCDLPCGQRLRPVAPQVIVCLDPLLSNDSRPE